MNVEPGQTQVVIVHHIENDGKLDKNKLRYINKKCLFYFTLAGIVVSAVLVVSALTMEIVKNSKNTPSQNSSAGPVKIISRKEWLAELPTEKLEQLKLPVSRVIIAHTAMANCRTLAECSQQVKIIQKYHMELDFGDIGYNFLIGGDGAIYVGRGWNLVGAHTLGSNFNSICFAFMGTFNSIEPPKHQLISAQKMIAEGVKLKKLTPDYALYGHRQLIATKSPGDALYEIIKKWNHWTNDPQSLIAF